MRRGRPSAPVSCIREAPPPPICACASSLNATEPRHEVANQAACRRASRRSRNDDRRRSAALLTDDRFDFARFDAETAQLHLMIEPPENLDLTVRQHTRRDRRCGTFGRHRTGSERNSRRSSPDDPRSRALRRRPRCGVRPNTPTGTGWSLRSSTYSCVLAIGLPDGDRCDPGSSPSARRPNRRLGRTVDVPERFRRLPAAAARARREALRRRRASSDQDASRSRPRGACSTATGVACIDVRAVRLRAAARARTGRRPRRAMRRRTVAPMTSGKNSSRPRCRTKPSSRPRVRRRRATRSTRANDVRRLTTLR